MSVLRRYLAIVFVVMAVAVCSAQSVQITPLPKDGRILVSLRMSDVFTENVRAAMHSGLRITFVYDIELKRGTALWVDRTIAAYATTSTAASPR